MKVMRSGTRMMPGVPCGRTAASGALARDELSLQRLIPHRDGIPGARDPAVTGGLSGISSCAGAPPARPPSLSLASEGCPPQVNFLSLTATCRQRGPNA